MKNTIKLVVPIIILCCVFIARKFANNSGIFFLALLIFLWVMLWITMKKLIVARAMHSDLRNNKIRTLRTKISKVSGIVIHSADSTKNAFAEYSFQGKQYSGKMICSYDRKIHENSHYKIFISEKFPHYFAMSECHIKNAFLTYVTWTIVFAVLVVIFTAIEALYIFSIINH